jgi:hypothetical protein
MNLYLAQNLKEDHVKDARCQTEHTRLVKTIQNKKRTQPFQFLALQHLRVRWNGSNNQIRLLIDNLWRRE